MHTLSAALLSSLIAVAPDADQPFVDLSVAVPGSVCAARYAGSENFIGHPLPGYSAQACWGTPQLAQALHAAQKALNGYGFSLIIFDAYRPQRTVDYFVRWTQDPSDTLRKADYYPTVPKSQLIPDGYIAARSGHSRGSTVDLSIIDAQTGKQLDMGTGFDIFSPQSGERAVGLTAEQRSNRLLLRSVMAQAGLVPYDAEWWHFRLKNEPYPDTYFDLPVE